MTQHNKLLIKNSILKAEEALIDAQSDLSLTLKQNI
jgi:hypothetical protein